MPHITVAMQRSVGRGAGSIIFDRLIGRRSITGEVSSVKSSFSSWDNCMKATYCKWPVIIVIIVISLMVFSILWCIIRCACCGMSCCCTCFSFLKCCDCCGGLCDGKKDKPMRHLDGPSSPRGPNQGYQAPAPMLGGPPASERAQFAHFEVGKNGLFTEPKPALSEDALPPMPSWDSAAHKHVMEEEKNGVELGHLDPTTGQSVPLMTGAAGPGTTTIPSPVHEMTSPYGAHPSHSVGGDGYTGVAGDPYSRYSPKNSVNGNGRYGGSPSPGPGMGRQRPGYGGPPSPGPGMGRQRPGYGGSPSPGPGMGRQRPGYGPPNHQNRSGLDRPGYSPSPSQDQYHNDQYVGTAIGGDGFEQPQLPRQYSNNDGRQYPPEPPRQHFESERSASPARQYSNNQYRNNFEPNGPPRRPSPAGPYRMESPRLVNNGGFDFSQGQQQPRERPSPEPHSHQGSSDDYFGAPHASPLHSPTSPPPQGPNQPKYRPYTPSSQGPSAGRAPAALTPGTAQGREPQGWDPVRQ